MLSTYKQKKLKIQFHRSKQKSGAPSEYEIYDFTHMYFKKAIHHSEQRINVKCAT